MPLSCQETWLHWERRGFPELTGDIISLRLTGLAFSTESLLSSSRGAGESRCSFPKWPRVALPFERFQETNWPGSAARQLTDGEVRCIRAAWAFSSQRLFLIYLFILSSSSVSPAAVCHSVPFALGLDHSFTQIHPKVQRSGLELILTLNMYYTVLFVDYRLR